MSGYDNLAAAYIGNLRSLLKHGWDAPAITDVMSPASRFGARPRGAREIIGHQFKLLPSKPSVVLPSSYKIDLAFLFGQFIWFIAGSDDLAWLSYYAPHASGFSHDGQTLCGSFGRRIFGDNSMGDQAKAVADLLKRDTGSRRALISVARPDDLLTPTKEFPCCSSLHFFVRSGALHVVSTMRAQQALTVLPYDVFLFCGLQSILASELGVDCGSYTQSSGTIHFYDNEATQARAIVSSGARCVELPYWKGGFQSVARIVTLERLVRSHVVAADGEALRALATEIVATPQSLEDVVANVCLLIGFEKLNLETCITEARASLVECGLYERPLSPKKKVKKGERAVKRDKAINKATAAVLRPRVK